MHPLLAGTLGSIKGIHGTSVESTCGVQGCTRLGFVDFPRKMSPGGKTRMYYVMCMHHALQMRPPRVVYHWGHHMITYNGHGAYTWCARRCVVGVHAISRKSRDPRLY